MGTKNFNSATDLITFTRASSSTFLGSNGLIQTATNNVPRIEYDADGTVKGLLIEEARTNLLKYSNEFTNVLWTKQAVTLTGSGVSPSGLTDATVITASANLAQHRVYQNLATISSYSKSVYAKAGTANFISVNGGNVAVGYAVFNLSTGVVSSQANIVQATMEDVGNGWYRCSIHGTVATQWMIVNMGTTDANAVPQVNWMGAGETVQLYGMQLEAGAFPTSYIPTSSSTATRAADIATIPTSAFGYNQKVGSVVVEFNSNKPNNEQYGAFGLSDGSPTNRIAYYATSVNTLVVTTAGVGQAQLSAGLRVTTSELVKLSAGYAENDFAASLNGATTVTDTSGTVPSGISVLGIGHYYPPNPNSNLINGHLKSIKYYPRRLTNTQLQELTT